MIYLGIDPGVNGGIAAIDKPLRALSAVDLNKMPQTDGDIDILISQQVESATVIACIETQVPRPTFIPSMGKSVILKSTCILYGNYMLIRGILTAYSIPIIEVTPKEWQAEFKLYKKKGESNTHWKNRLKAKAQQLYPHLKITLATADALLIAEYCKRNH